jgi:xanthine dehydrogenase molybdopterin-binding subunit B
VLLLLLLCSIGGGFGGKESRSMQFSCPVAIAAHTLGQPVRINIERDVDMSLSGQRHAFHAKYRAGCTASGQFKFMDVQLFNNAGYSLDLSGPVMGRALFHVDGPYRYGTLFCQCRYIRSDCVNFQVARPSRHREVVSHQSALPHRFQGVRRSSGHDGHRNCD